MSLNPELSARIEGLLKSHEFVLFMKGNRETPKCGFSASIVGFLDEWLTDYATVDVLADAEIRDGIKAFSNWPTIPQLYVKGEFVGGGDIIRELANTGELGTVLGKTRVETPIPTLRVTETAKKAFLDALGGKAGEFVHFRVGARGMFELNLGPKEPGELEVEADGLVLLLDRGSARRADGIVIDFVRGPGGAGFKIENPNGPPSVQQMTAAQLKDRLDKGEAVHVFDVRTPQERLIAKLPFAQHLDEVGQKVLFALPKDAPIVFHCHHGGRSQQAADHFLTQGFTRVWNLSGGIDAWSQQVDPSVPRY